MDESETESEYLEIEKQLSTLKDKSKGVEDSLVSAMNRLKVVQHKIKIEVDEMSQSEMRCKASLRKWLEKRGFSKEISFEEFFQKFLDEHREEDRLDMMDRTILLNKDAAKLFDLKEESKLTVLQLIEKLPLIYY
jgi:hypothetical protein